MSVHICPRCRSITYCDFYPCDKCQLGPKMSDLCVKVLLILRDYEFAVCEACHAQKKEKQQVVLIGIICSAVRIASFPYHAADSTCAEIGESRSEKYVYIHDYAADLGWIETRDTRPAKHMDIHTQKTRNILKKNCSNVALKRRR